MDDEIKYRVKATVDGGFGVGFGPINGGMTTVTPFQTEAEAQAWIEKQIRIHGTGAPSQGKRHKKA
jgi:hypothetical protein